MSHRLTRRRRLFVLVFIVILFAAVWLVLQPPPGAAQAFGFSRSMSGAPSEGSAVVSRVG